MSKQIKDYAEETTPVAADLLVAQKSSSGETIQTNIVDAIPDNSLTGANIDFSTSGNIWWEELARSELTIEDDYIELSFEARKYLYIQILLLGTGTVGQSIYFNNDNGGTSYARRRSDNGGADVTNASEGDIGVGTAATYGILQAQCYLVNVANQEKIGFMYTTTNTSSGAGTAPTRRQQAFKWANTTNQITSARVQNSSAGGYLAGSRVIVRGHD